MRLLKTEAEAGALTEPSIGGQVQNVNNQLLAALLALYRGGQKTSQLRFPSLEPLFYRIDRLINSAEARA